MSGSDDQHGQSRRPSLWGIAQKEGGEDAPSEEKMPGSVDQHEQSRRPSLWGIAQNEGAEDAPSAEKMPGSDDQEKQPGGRILARIVQDEGAGYDAQRNNFKRKPKRLKGFDRDFYEAVRRGDLNAVKKMLAENSKLLNTKFTFLEENALQVAVVAGQEDIVDHLLKQILPAHPEFLKTKNYFGDTALTLAAATGSRAIVQLLVEENEDLVDIMNGRGQLAVVVAALRGHEETVRYLYDFTLVESLYPVQGQETEAVGNRNGFMLFKACITAEIYDIALDAFNEGPNQCIEEIQKEKGKTLCSLAIADFGTPRINGFLPWLYHSVSSRLPTWVLAYVTIEFVQWGFVKKYRSHHGLARKLLRAICKELSSSNLSDIHSILGNPTFAAVLQENVDFVKIVIQEFPDVIWLQFEGLPILGHAISKGLDQVYTFFCKRTEIRLLPSMIPNSNDNSLLHQAAELSPSPQLGLFLGPALQMQRELQRFEEVEKVAPMCRKLMNKENQTPRDLFIKTHTDLKEAARNWLKDIAQSCSVVATLIVTIMFTAAFTVPGGENDGTGIPRKLGSKYFTIYIISDALSLVFSCTSAMIFLGIHTSLFRVDDFRIKLPLALMFGLLTLFLSIATMMIAFGIALFIMLQEHFMWISIPVLTLGSIPVSIYAILHVRIFIHVFRSTFRRSPK